jgi:FKBP-type peptidyl-prolyl cis-trans isomerase 2
MAIEKGKKVKIEYEGSLDNGQVFDSSEKHGQPLEFVIGEGKVIPGFEKAVVEMNKGEEKTIKIECKDAYGEKRPELMKRIPKEQLPEEARDKVKAGMVLGMNTPQGQQVPVKVVEVGDNDITLDLNHPLAGQNLNFKIKVIDVE